MKEQKKMRFKFYGIAILLFLIMAMSLIMQPYFAYAAGTIGGSYSFTYPVNLPSADHETYGHAIYAQPSYASKVSLEINSKGEKSQFDKYRILTHQMYDGNRVINMPVVQYFNSYYVTNPYSSYTKTLERTVSNTKTYEEELSVTIATKVGYQAGVKIEGVGVSANAEVQAAIKGSVGFTNTIFVSERTTDTMTIPASTEQKYLMWEERADFEVMCIQVFEIQYSKTNEQSHGALWWKYTSWDMKETSMILREEFFVYKYLGTGKFNGLFEYTLSDGHFIYNGPKPSSNVLYI